MALGVPFYTGTRGTILYWHKGCYYILTLGVPSLNGTGYHLIVALEVPFYCGTRGTYKHVTEHPQNASNI